MLKQIILLLSLIHLMQCLSIRSNIWWSRRNDDMQGDCDIELNNENPSLESKICGYCFAKCQQKLAGCLMTNINNVGDESIDYCQEKASKCEKHCFNDKRTSEIAEANWAKVVKVLQSFNTFSSTEEEKNHPNDN